MRKFILAFILSILFISFGAFLLNAYMLQKNYFGQSKNNNNFHEAIDDAVIVPKSVYLQYSKEDYDKALKENRVILLYFTSNWCKECRDQASINSLVMEDMLYQSIVGLDIHILDSETTTETDALAKKFDVTKESTLVILDKTGAVVFKYTGDITSEMLKSKIQEVINK